MSWLCEVLGGPVLAWEFKLSTRRKFARYLALGYSIWLTMQALALFWGVGGAIRKSPNAAETRFSQFAAMYEQLMVFLEGYLAMLLQFQLMLVIGIIPALTASCLGQEKERGTLFALFGTQLSSRQMLLGKLLGRLVLIVPIVFAALPVMVFIAIVTGRGLTLLFLALAQEAVFALAIGAICLLFGIWIRRAADAVVAAYICLGLGYLAVRRLASPWPGMFWFDPIENLHGLLNHRNWWMFAYHLAVWAFLGAICLRVGWGRLRKVCLEQRDELPSPQLWAFRPPVGNNPIRWRECYVIGLSPMPILRVVPRWAALLAILLFSTVIAGVIAYRCAPGSVVALQKMDFAGASRELSVNKRAIADSVWLMGLVFIALADSLLLIRCTTSVAEEKRRNTWDDLLLTAQSFREITRGKMWGILQATVPYVIAYALPVFFLAALGGPGALFIAGLWIVLPCLIVLASALSGIDMLKVPPDMDETREGGAFWFEKERARAQRLRVRR